MVETGFPVTGVAARTFGWHDQLQRPGCGLDGGDRCRHQIVGAFTLHRYAAEPAHQTSKRWFEDLFLAHPVDVQPQAESHHQRVGQVPVAGVRRGNQNALVAVGGQTALDLPASEFQKADGKKAQQGVENRCVEDGVVHKLL